LKIFEANLNLGKNCLRLDFEQGGLQNFEKIIKFLALNHTEGELEESYESLKYYSKGESKEPFKESNNMSFYVDDKLSLFFETHIYPLWHSMKDS